MILSFWLLLVLGMFLASGLDGQTVSDTRPELAPAISHAAAWWPNRGSEPRSAYAGPHACAECHPSIVASWQKSQMAHAMRPAAESSFLRAHRDSGFERGPYTYRITTENNRSVYSVTDGKQTLSIPLLWAYGTGVVGQAFLFQVNGTYYESEAAYYPILNRLSVVAGLPTASPATLEEAFGLPLVPVAARQCISCHTTAAVTSGKLEVDTMIRGVTCEACHGPGAHHIALMQKGATAEAAGASIFNPGTLDPVEVENFCGECHRTSRLVTLEGLHGLDTVHYEPYRLEMSQCWIMTRRITCLTCHDPHQPLQRDPAAYDAACLSCHPSKPHRVTVAGQAKACPVAKHNCVTCHMPKCRLPRAPFTMADHFIRVVRSNDACSQS